MPPDTIYVDDSEARAAWQAWNDALAARCDHELVCLMGCDTRERHCLIGLALKEREQFAWLAYFEAAEVAEVAA